MPSLTVPPVLVGGANVYTLPEAGLRVGLSGDGITFTPVKLPNVDGLLRFAPSKTEIVAKVRFEIETPRLGLEAALNDYIAFRDAAHGDANMQATFYFLYHSGWGTGIGIGPGHVRGDIGIERFMQSLTSMLSTGTLANIPVEFELEANAFVNLETAWTAVIDDAGASQPGGGGGGTPFALSGPVQMDGALEITNAGGNVVYRADTAGNEYHTGSYDNTYNVGDLD